MKYPELPLFAFLTAFLVLIPIPWHWRARNVATLSIIAWLFVVNFIYGVNALLWADNVEIKAVVWCDIATKIVVGASFALPLGTLCVCKHLEAVSSTRHVHVDLKRRMIFEGVTCFGIPMVFMALHYIVQGHRFDIVEDIGCSATIYFSIPAILIIWFPQLLFATITFIYAAIAIHHFVQRRAVFAFRAGASGLTASRYIRLIAMSVTEMAWVTAFSALNLWSNVTATGLRPYTSWAYVHSDFSRIDNEYIRALIPDWYWRRIMLFWWLMPASAIIFFLFFGFGQEATKEYRRVWKAADAVWEKTGVAVWEKTGRQWLPDKKPFSFGSGSPCNDAKKPPLPVYTPPLLPQLHLTPLDVHYAIHHGSPSNTTKHSRVASTALPRTSEFQRLPSQPYLPLPESDAEVTSHHKHDSLTSTYELSTVGYASPTSSYGVASPAATSMVTGCPSSTGEPSSYYDPSLSSYDFMPSPLMRRIGSLRELRFSLSLFGNPSRVPVLPPFHDLTPLTHDSAPPAQRNGVRPSTDISVVLSEHDDAVIDICAPPPRERLMPEHFAIAEHLVPIHLRPVDVDADTPSARPRPHTIAGSPTEVYDINLLESRRDSSCV